MEPGGGGEGEVGGGPMSGPNPLPAGLEPSRVPVCQINASPDWGHSPGGR